MISNTILTLSLFIMLGLKVSPKPYPVTDNFEKQQSLAKQKGQKLILVFGHNRCSSCLYLSENLDKFFLTSEMKFEFVKINSKSKSGEKLKKALNLDFKGVPHFTIFDPVTEKVFDEKHYSESPLNNMTYLNKLVNAFEEVTQHL